MLSTSIQNYTVSSYSPCTQKNFGSTMQVSMVSLVSDILLGLGCGGYRNLLVHFEALCGKGAEVLGGSAFVET